MSDIAPDRFIDNVFAYQKTAAVKAAIDGMYADGTMKSIVDKWGMTDAVVLLK